MTTVSLSDIPVIDLELPKGTRVTSGNDTYLIQKRLGRGGFGAIYRATSEGVDYALKIAAGDLQQRQLVREAEITATLSKIHLSVFSMKILQNATITLPFPTTPNRESGGHASQHSTPQHLERDDLAVGVIRDMSRLGVVLSDLLANDNDLSDVIEMMLAILHVLRPIHETEGLQYLHGDISPENILYVPSNDTAVFIDFGNAQQLEQDGRALVARNEFSYNPVFMSPEIRAFVASQRKAVSLSKASDIYSLGLILYGLLFEAPDMTSSEHIAVLARNRINENERSGVWSKTVSQMMMGLFESSLAADEDSRIQDLAELSSRLSEIRNLLGDADITKAGMYYRLLEYNASYLPNSRFLIDLEDEKGCPVDLDNELSDIAAHTPVVLSGIRGSGKTTLIRATAHRLLETEGVVPVVIDAGELRDAWGRADMLRALAVTVYRNVFGHRDPPKPHVVTKLITMLGLHAIDGSTPRDVDGSNGRFSMSGDGEGTDFVVFIDNADLLEDNPDARSQLADIVRSTAKTRFVFCENGSLPRYGRQDGEQGVRPGVRQDMRPGARQDTHQDMPMPADERLFCLIRPLSVEKIRESLRRDLNLECSPYYAETLTTPALLALLYEEFASDLHANQPGAEELTLDRLYPVLERFYRYGQDLRFEELSRLAYFQLTIRRQQTFSLPVDADFTRWLLCEGAIRPAPDDPAPGDSPSGDPAPDGHVSDRRDTGGLPPDGQVNYRFRSSLVGDFFASHLVTQIIRRATHATHLSEINHIWHKGLIDMLSALPAEALVTLTTKVQRLTEDTGVAETFRYDLIPSNMFALTGDDLWATLSMHLADSLFHETVLDGYFAYRSEIILASDVERERPLRYDLLNGNALVLCARVPPRCLQTLIADLRYGYRLPQNHKLADQLADQLATRLLKGR
jgi:serine/threonine protein kinase